MANIARPRRPDRCTCCGSGRLVKMGADITETLEAIPRQWKVIQTVREKFTCRACEKHQPLNRQAARFAHEGAESSLSTLADLVGHATVALNPIVTLIENHVRAAARLHGDDTIVPLLARGGAKKARLWAYVLDDRPWNGEAPPAAFVRFSRDREKTNPNQHLAGYQGVLQADACGGYNDPYHADRVAGPVTSALCWAHARRKFFELADIAGNVHKEKPAHQISPIALETVKRIDAIFDIERESHGLDADACLAVRQELSRPLVNGLHDWLLAERAKLSRHNKVTKAITTCSRKKAVGRPSRHSVTMGASASRTMRPNAPCAAWHWVENHGFFLAPSVADSGLMPCIPSSSRQK